MRHGDTTTNTRELAALAGLGWRTQMGLIPGESTVRILRDGQVAVEIRHDGRRRIVRLRWQLPSGERVAQFSTLTDAGIHLTSATGSGVVVDRQLVVRSQVWRTFERTLDRCQHLDAGVSDATVERVFADALRRDDIVLESLEKAFFDGWRHSIGLQDLMPDATQPLGAAV